MSGWAGLKPCAWARRIMREGGYCVVDTETTGLEADARIASIGIVGEQGETLYYSLINPEMAMPFEAERIHGLSDAMLADAPTWAQAWPAIRRALRGRRILAYNHRYDLPRMIGQCERAGVLWVDEREDGSGPDLCIMVRFAAHYGMWNAYHGNYRWQPLATAAGYCRLRDEGYAHHALGDAQRAWGVLRWMALSEERPERADNEGDES